MAAPAFVFPARDEMRLYICRTAAYPRRRPAERYEAPHSEDYHEPICRTRPLFNGHYRRS